MQQYTDSFFYGLGFGFRSACGEIMVMGYVHRYIRELSCVVGEDRISIEANDGRFYCDNNNI